MVHPDESPSYSSESCDGNGANLQAKVSEVAEQAQERPIRP